MWLAANGSSCGLVSGGCLEEDLAERAREVLSSRRASSLLYDLRSPDDVVWGLGLGCDGAIRVLVEPLLSGALDPTLERLLHWLRARNEGVLVTVFEAPEGAGARIGDRLAVDSRGVVGDSIGDPELRAELTRVARNQLENRRSAHHAFASRVGRIETLLEFVAPSPQLLLCGAGADALPLVRLACELGWPVRVADARPAFARVERFPAAESVVLVDPRRLDAANLAIDRYTAAVVMTHHFHHDLAWLACLLDTPAPYIGLLGPQRRAERLRVELSRQRHGALPPGAGERLHAPVGLDIGADSPVEIALAVLGEIRAVLAGRYGGRLRDRRGALHEWP